MVVDESVPLDETKEYQTLFWVPMLFQTAKNSEALIEEMLDMIQDFHDSNAPTMVRRQSIRKGNGIPRRRQQILGEVIDSESPAVTRVDVVTKSENTRFNLLTVLKRHFLFSQLRDYELEDVVDVMQAKYASAGEVIIQQGDPGDLFYILEEGSCEININGENLGQIDSGSSFGDLALMYNCPRAATISAKTYCTLWTLDRVFFRQAMVTSSSNQNVQLSQFLSKIALFASLGPQQLNQLARSLTKQSYDAGHYIIKQGDLSDQFYVIFKGTVTVSRTDDIGNEHMIAELHEGEVFGERALIKKEPRKANIIAHGPVECYYLESQDFYSMLGEFVEKFNKMNELRIIRSAKVLSPIVVNDFRLQELIDQFASHRMFSGQRLVCGTGEIFLVIDGIFQGANGEKYTPDGLVQVGGLDKTADEVAGALTALSDDALLFSFTKEQLVDTIRKCEEDSQRKLRRTSFLGNSGRLRSISENGSISGGGGNSSGLDSSTGHSNTTAGVTDGEQEIAVTAQRRRETAHARRQSLADFVCHSLAELDVLTALGKGTFGSVFLCEHKVTGRKMALKCLDKKAIVNSGQHLYVRREVIALQNFQHPFLSEYFGVILSAQKVCFLLEFIPGGELWTYLYDEKFVASHDRVVGEFGGLPVEQACLFAANVILAIEHMHRLGYTYRDLKPENLMISYNGYLKLVDFGFAKQVPFVNKSNHIQYRTFTLCGTPDYMAPELVLTQGHDKSVDYWAYGVLVYELMCGQTPFESSNQQRTFEKIVHAQKHLSFPQDFDPHGKSLIRRLLHPNAALRLGALQNGIADITHHAFFSMKNVDFEGLLAQEIDMVYKPNTEDVSSSVNAATVGEIEPLDLETELGGSAPTEWDSFFADLNNPDILEQLTAM